MDLQLPQLMLIAAGINLFAAVLLAFRALDSRAGAWALGLGIVLALHAAAIGLVQHAYPQLIPVWWLSYMLLPGFLLPLTIAVANIGLLRGALLFLNAVLWLAALVFAAWLLQTIRPLEQDWGLSLNLPVLAKLLFAWAGTVWLAAILDCALQWGRAIKPAKRRRMASLFVVLCLLAVGWLLDGVVLLGLDVGLPGSVSGSVSLQPLGFAPFGLAYLILFVLLWVQKGPRRISGTISPAIIAASKQPLLIADSDGRIQAVNAAAVQVLDRRRPQVLGKELKQVLGLDIEYLDTVTRLHGAGYVERIQVQVRSVKAVRELALQPLVLRAANGEVLAVICTLNPGSDDPALAATSLYDPVTGLAGAALGEALVAQELRRHAGGSGPLVAAVYVRLDDTSLIASRHGQAVHDRLQNALTERLKAVCDWPLDLARSAAGGYLMLLTQVTDQHEVLSIADRAHELLSKPFNLDDQQLQPPVLIAVIPDLRVYHDIVDLLADVRDGLERARHAPQQPFIAGRRAEERINLALALEAAIASDGLDLALEPVVDLRSERAVGLRAMVRWAPEGMPAIEDGALRRLARRVHLEGPLNHWRLKQLASMRFPNPWAVWLPLSVEELLTPGFTKVFPKTVTRLPFKIILEAPDAIWQLPACRKIAAELSEAGIGLHGEDFSAGSRMITHAAGLLPKTLSLDPRLVQMHGPAVDAAVRGLAETAQLMGATLRGNGVRKKADLRRLRSLGVGLACGEYLGGVMQSQAFEAWLAAEDHLLGKLEGTAIGVPRAEAGASRRRPVV